MTNTRKHQTVKKRIGVEVKSLPTTNKKERTFWLKKLTLLDSISPTFYAKIFYIRHKIHFILQQLH